MPATEPSPATPDDAVMIVGAGPTGLALALSLADAGVAVRVIDRNQRPATTSRAIGIQARTLEMLEPYGISEELLALGHCGHAGNIYSGSRHLVHLDLTPLPSRYPFLLFVEQTETERVLTEALEKRGVRIERGTEAGTFIQNADGVDLVMHRDGRQLIGQCAYLVGCDGAHSVVRHGLEMPFTGKALQQDFVLADLVVNWDLSDEEFHIFTSPNGLIAIFPMIHGHRLIAEVPAGRDQDPVIEELRDIVSQRIEVDVRLSGLRWSSHFRVNSRLATALQHGRIFLAGDAAHVHSPAGAQGMNTGIQDALNLGWKMGFVVKGQASPDLLATYQAERHPVERRVLRNTERLTFMVSLKSRTLRRIRDWLAPRLTSLDAVQRTARMMISELDVGYHALAADRWPSPLGLRAGDRFPDCGVRGLDRQGASRLNRELRPGRLTLLLVGVGVPPPDQDRYHRAHIDILFADRGAPTGSAKNVRSGALSGWWYLIRPDGYLASHGPAGRGVVDLPKALYSNAVRADLDAAGRFVAGLAAT